MRAFGRKGGESCKRKTFYSQTGIMVCVIYHTLIKIYDLHRAEIIFSSLEIQN